MVFKEQYLEAWVDGGVRNSPDDKYTTIEKEHCFVWVFSSLLLL